MVLKYTNGWTNALVACINMHMHAAVKVCKLADRTVGHNSLFLGGGGACIVIMNRDKCQIQISPVKALHEANLVRNVNTCKQKKILSSPLTLF